jgi:hypothetical protein
MFATLFRSLRAKKPARRDGRRPFHPTLEAFEERCLLNGYTWVPVAAVFSGDFNDGAHWRNDQTGTTGDVPGPIDDASIPGGDYQVTITQQHEVNSLSNGARLRLMGGGRLTLDQVGRDSPLPGLVMEQDSTLEVLQRTLILNGSDLAGTVGVAQDATLRWLRGDNYLNPGVALTGVSLMGLGTFLSEGDVFGAPGIHLNTDLTAPNNFTLRNGVLDGAGTLTIDTTFNWIQGGAGGTTMAGMGVTNVLSGATLNIGGLGVTLSRRTLNNNGTTVMNATGPLSFSDSGTFNNNGTFNLQTDVNFGGLGTFDNEGEFTKTSAMSSGTSVIDSTFRNAVTGTATVQSGVLQLGNGGGASSGTFNAVAGATLEFSAHSFGGITYTLNTGAQLMGSGHYRVTIAPSSAPYTLALNTDVFPQNFELKDGGILSGPGTLTVTGNLAWTGGTMADANGTTRLDATATLDIRGASPKAISGRTLDLSGTVNWSEGNVNLSSGATINIQTGGSFNILSDGINLTGNGLFRNLGTVTKQNLPGTALLAGGIAFLNDDPAALVSIQSGIFQIDNFTQNAGTTIVGAGARLDSAGNLTLNAGILSGTGIVRVNGGNGTVDNVAATIAPGSSDAVGTLTIDGNYVQEGPGALVVRLTHDATGQPQSDQLRVTGRATLHGILSLQALDSVFADAEAFRVLQAQSFDSTFNTFDMITGLTLPDGHTLDPQYDANGLSLVAT